MEISSSLGPKWHSPIGSMLFHRAQKTLDFQGPIPLPLALVMDPHVSKTLRMGTDWAGLRIRIRRSGLDPDSIGSVDPYPDPDPGGQKLPTKVEFFLSSCFEVLDGLF
jgi:hypothetical protein